MKAMACSGIYLLTGYTASTAKHTTDPHKVDFERFGRPDRRSASAQASDRLLLDCGRFSIATRQECMST